MGVFLYALGEEKLLVIGGITSIGGASLMTISIPFHLSRKPKKSIFENLAEYNYKLILNRLNLDCNEPNFP